MQSRLEHVPDHKPDQYRIYILLFLLLVLAFECRPLDDHDIFTQVALGKLAIKRGALLTTEPFLTGYHSTQWVNPGWLWQLVGAGIVQELSLRALKISHSLLLAGAMMLAVSALPLRKQTGAIFSAVIIAGIPLFVFASVRPQIVAFFCFAAVYFLLRRVPPSFVRDAGILLLCVIWQNAHTSLILVFPLLAFADSDRGLLSCLTVRRFLLTLCCAAALFATPLGVAALTFAPHNYEISRELFQITEWFSPLELPISFFPAFWLSLVSMLVLAIWQRSRLECKDVLLWSIFLLASLIAVRFVAFWALISLPLVRLLSDNISARWWPERLWSSTAVLFRRMAVLTLVGGLVFHASRTPLVSSAIELECITALGDLPPASRVFNDRRMAGILVFTYGDRYSIAADGRLYLYTPDQWRAILAERSGAVPLAQIDAHWQPQAYLIDPRHSAALIAQLDTSPAWRKGFTGHSCTVYLPATSRG